MASEARPFAVESWVERRVRIPGTRRFTMVVDQSATDPLSRSYLTDWRRSANTYLLNVMAAVTRPGDKVLDVGAFAGEFALTAAARRCDVLALEANPNLAAMITASAEINGFARLQVLNAAAGDHPGMVQFHSHGPWGQVIDSAWGPEGQYDTVRQVTIDDVVTAAGWSSVAFLKLDVEGSEMRALAGATRLLWDDDAPALLFESNTAALMHHGTAPSALLGFVASFGYSLFRVTPAEIVQSSSETFQPEVVSDYLALKHATPADFGLAVRAPLTDVETANRIAREAFRESADHRAALAWQLQFASGALRGLPRVRESLAALANDPEERVRESLRWQSDDAPAFVPPTVALLSGEDGRDGAKKALEESAEARRQTAERLGSRRRRSSRWSSRVRPRR